MLKKKFILNLNIPGKLNLDIHNIPSLESYLDKSNRA